MGMLKTAVSSWQAGRCVIIAAALGITTNAVWAKTPLPADQASEQQQTAIFAGGCFWCVEADFEKLSGVISAESGYIGGHTASPSYEQVSGGGTGHTEAVRLVYDPRKVDYPTLVDHFWRHIDPTVKDKQFCDSGSQYRSAIFWQNEQEKQIAEKSRDALLTSGKFNVIHTEISAATTFYPAETYHQDYYLKNPIRYEYYRLRCGRDERIKEVWGDTSD
jgi:peptide-methionine (S)-S-oxide reductase